MRVPRAPLVAAALAAALSLAAGGARADDKRAAQKLLDQGNALVTDGDYVAALERFRSAYALFPSPKILLNLGTTLRGLGRNAEAAEQYERYLADPGHDPAREGDVRRILGDIGRAVTTLRIRANEPDARIVVDGKAQESYRAGEPLRVDPGEHTVVGEKPGLSPAVKRLSTRAGELVDVNLRLLPPEVRTVVTVSTAQRNIALVMGGVGLVGVGVGVTYGILAASKNGDASKHCLTDTVCDATGVSLGDAARARATVSTVGLIVGGVVLSTGVVLYLTSPSFNAPAAPAQVSVGASPGRLFVAGSF